MELKLCYKSYDFNVTLGACKSFYDQTGKDLQSVLLKYLSSCASTGDQTLTDRMISFHDVCSFEDASILVSCLVKSEQKEIPLSEIQDGMFRSGWLPNDHDTEYLQPWPLLLVDIATKVNKYFSDNLPKKPQASEAEQA